MEYVISDDNQYSDLSWKLLKRLGLSLDDFNLKSMIATSSVRIKEKIIDFFLGTSPDFQDIYDIMSLFRNDELKTRLIKYLADKGLVKDHEQWGDLMNRVPLTDQQRDLVLKLKPLESSDFVNQIREVA